MTQERIHRHFLELIHTHQNIIHKICFVYCRNKADKEDLQQEIDEDALSTITLRDQRNKKRRMTLIFLLALLCGLLVLAFFIFR